MSDLMQDMYEFEREKREGGIKAIERLYERERERADALMDASKRARGHDLENILYKFARAQGALSALHEALCAAIRGGDE